MLTVAPLWVISRVSQQVKVTFSPKASPCTSPCLPRFPSGREHWPPGLPQPGPRRPPPPASSSHASSFSLHAPRARGLRKWDIRPGEPARQPRRAHPSKSPAGGAAPGPALDAVRAAPALSYDPGMSDDGIARLGSLLTTALVGVLLPKDVPEAGGPSAPGSTPGRASGTSSMRCTVPATTWRLFRVPVCLVVEVPPGMRQHWRRCGRTRDHRVKVVLTLFLPHDVAEYVTARDPGGKERRRGGGRDPRGRKSAPLMTDLEEQARLNVPKERGGAMVIRQGLLSLALVVILVASSASTGGAQPGLDPQSLIGEWTGKWTSGAVTGGPGPRSGREGPFALMITQVQGNVVHGTVEVAGVTTKIRATLQGNQLRFGNEQIQTELTIDGDHMRGTRQRAGTPQALLDLERRSEPGRSAGGPTTRARSARGATGPWSTAPSAFASSRWSITWRAGMRAWAYMPRPNLDGAAAGGELMRRRLRSVEYARQYCSPGRTYGGQTTRKGPGVSQDRGTRESGGGDGLHVPLAFPEGERSR